MINRFLKIVIILMMCISILVTNSSKANATTIQEYLNPVDEMSEIVNIVSHNNSKFGIDDNQTLWAWGDNYYGQLGDGTNNNRSIPFKVLQNVKSIKTIWSSTFAILNDNSLWAWGRNLRGQLGDGTTLDRNFPVKILDNVRSINVSNLTTFAILNDGSLWSWGDNSYGKLGDSSFSNRSIPVKILSDVSSISSDNSSVFVILNDSSLWAWGDNSYGKLGDGTTSQRSSPTKIIENVQSIMTVDSSTFTILKDESLWSWGRNDYGQLGDSSTSNRSVPRKVLDNVKSITAGNYSVFAILNEDSLWSWGSNSVGQLGDGTTTHRSVPWLIHNDVQDFIVSGGSSYSVLKDGSMWTWGVNNYGQLGDGTTLNRSTPMRILEDIHFLYAADSSVFAINNDNDLFSWGRNVYGKLGDGTSNTIKNPTKVLQNVITLFAQGSSIFAKSADGSLWSWGYNTYGQLGDGTVVDRSSPIQVFSKLGHGLFSDFDYRKVKQFKNSMSAFLLFDDGSLWSWGRNNSGQLGNGTTNDQNIPQKILDNVKLFETSSDQSFAILNNGSLWSWGRNDKGQLGDGTIINRSTPVKILDDVHTIKVGDSTSFAIQEDGSLWSWGQNNYGSSGTGVSGIQATPSKILENVTLVDIFIDHSIALLSDGSLWSWGRNDKGQVGDGTTSTRSTPVKVLENVQSISMTHGGSSFALRYDSSLWSWGYNLHGNLGDGTNTDRSTPVNVLENVRSISMSSYSSYAVKNDSSLWSWGYNGSGELGDGTTISRRFPTKVMENVRINFRTITIKNDSSLWSWGLDSSGQPVKVMDNIMSVSLGESSFAIQYDGSLWSWGRNYLGQLGDGTTTDRSIPVKVLDNVISVSTGESPFALQYNGSLWTWGWNLYGQIGDGTLNNKSSPVRVKVPQIYNIDIGSDHLFVKTNFSGRFQLSYFPTNYDGTIKFTLLSEDVPGRFTIDDQGSFDVSQPVTAIVSITNSSGTILYKNISITAYDSVIAKGVINGKSYNRDVQIFFRDSLLSYINGQSLTNGDIIREEGSYQIEFTDAVGEVKKLAFTIDKTPPIITVVPYDATPTNKPVTIFATTDEGQQLFHTFIDNGSFEFVATDRAGNIGTLTVTVNHIDLIPPEVYGVENGKHYNQDVTITFSEGTVKLNNTEISSGTTIRDEGSYTLNAMDDLGNTMSLGFVIDKTPPVITIEPYSTIPTNQDVVIKASTNEGILNKILHVFTENGSFTFIATDLAGNISEKTVTISHIDKTPPEVFGVENNQYYNTSKTITFNEGTATLDGQSFFSGGVVSAEGEYTLIVTDDLGNKNTIYFIIDKTAPVITITPYSTETTHLPVTISVTADEGTLNNESHTFNENGSFTFVATDLAGNVTEETVTITHIVSPTQVKTISISQLPSKLNYIQGEQLNPTGGAIAVTTYEGVLSTVSLSLDMLSGYDPYSSVYGPQTVTVTYQGVTTTFEVYLNRFIDVPYGHRNYTHINALVGLGIINGYSDNTFRPNNTLTRAQAAIMIVRAAGISTEGVSSNFTDVPSSHAAHKFISAAYQAGIINGYSDGTFKPNANVTRAQIAIMVQRAFNVQSSGTIITFTDVPEGYAPKKFIEILASQKIVNGYSDGTFKPLNNVTRAQFSTMIYNAIQYVQKTE
jgi:alpha-tubulin suppressor-like RCC1 family protein